MCHSPGRTKPQDRYLQLVESEDKQPIRTLTGWHVLLYRLCLETRESVDSQIANYTRVVMVLGVEKLAPF